MSVTRTIKWEHTRTRATVYIENHLLETLNRHVDMEKGMKTEIVNRALEMYFAIHNIQVTRQHKYDTQFHKGK